MILAMLLALTTLFVGFGTLSQNPTSGGYQLFERVASGHQADIQLSSLGNSGAGLEAASEYANATNNGPRFVTDAAGNTIDVNATRNLTSLSPSDVNFQAGRGSPTFDSTAAPNSYANLGNGHAIVYGPDGRALYDVSAGRVKVVVWNTNPNTGQSFPNWGSDSKAFVGNVPQSLLDDLGLN